MRILASSVQQLLIKERQKHPAEMAVAKAVFGRKKKTVGTRWELACMNNVATLEV